MSKWMRTWNNHGVTWEEFTVFDSDLATSMTIEEDWERNLVAHVVMLKMTA